MPNKADLDKMVADDKLKTWTELFYLRQDQFDNPDRPVMSAWMATNRYSEQIFIMKRNPYYVGVDTGGQPASVHGRDPGQVLRRSSRLEPGGHRRRA